MKFLSMGGGNCSKLYCRTRKWRTTAQNSITNYGENETTMPLGYHREQLSKTSKCTTSSVTIENGTWKREQERNIPVAFGLKGQANVNFA